MSNFDRIVSATRSVMLFEHRIDQLTVEVTGPNAAHNERCDRVLRLENIISKAQRRVEAPRLT